MALERLALALTLGALVPVLLAVSVAGRGLSLDPLDFAIVAAAGVAFDWIFRRQLRRSIASAPPLPPGVSLDSSRATVRREIWLGLLVGALLGLLAPDGGGAEALFCAALAGAVAVDAVRLRRWERRTGRRVYRDRKVWARGAPFFYLR